MSSDDRKAIPPGREMPREERLAPPAWEQGRTAPPNGSAFHAIGRRSRKLEGLAKVTGRAVYADDIALPRMLHAKIKRSIHAHARILAIDATEALAMPGVHAVVTGRDMPEKFGIIPWTRDEQALCETKARYVGDAIAAVAADTELLAEQALEKIRVTYEVLPAIAGIDEALGHPETQVNENAAEGNISKHVHLEFGEVDQVLAASDAVVEAEYWYEGSTHGAIEPHCCVAEFDATGFLTLWSSTQVAHYLHRDLARVLGLLTRRIRVIQPVVGGAFGGKSEPFSLEFCAAKLALITGRPVKILYTREEVFYAHRGRHPMRLKYRTGVTRDGRLVSSRPTTRASSSPRRTRCPRTASIRRACSRTSPAAGRSAGTARCSRASRSSASSTSSPRKSAWTRSRCAGRTRSAATPAR